jgi:hypothetical protein
MRVGLIWWVGEPWWRRGRCSGLWCAGLSVCEPRCCGLGDVFGQRPLAVAGEAAFAEAADLYRRSWEDAPPASNDRLVGMLKSAVLARGGRGRGRVRVPCPRTRRRWFADTALMLERLAAAREIAAGVESPLLRRSRRTEQDSRISFDGVGLPGWCGERRSRRDGPERCTAAVLARLRHERAAGEPECCTARAARPPCHVRTPSAEGARDVRDGPVASMERPPLRPSLDTRDRHVEAIRGSDATAGSRRAGRPTACARARRRRRARGRRR